ncbi:MAG TPA: hypothetical protein VGB83_07915 [Actinomycetota bacterium]
MKAHQTDAARPTTLVVGRDSPQRTRLCNALVSQGMSVLVCPGTPPCILDHEDRCPLLHVADHMIVLGQGQSPTRLRCSRAFMAR